MPGAPQPAPASAAPTTIDTGGKRVTIETPTAEAPDYELPEAETQPAPKTVETPTKTVTVEAPEPAAEDLEKPALKTPPVTPKAPEETKPQGDGQRTAPIVYKTPEDYARINTAPIHENPSAGQAEAGNYQHVHVQWQGMDLGIETRAGDIRSSKDPQTPWEVKMPAPYGKVKRTTGADGEELDITLGPNPNAKNVFVIDQKDLKTGAFDEHKAFGGFDSMDDATDAYTASFSDKKGGDRIGGVTEMTVPQFKAWAESGDLTKSLAMPETKAPEAPSAPGSVAPKDLPAPPGWDKGSWKDISPNYKLAIWRMAGAQYAYNQKVEAYRAQKIGDDEYLKARNEYEAAKAEFDEARGEAPPAKAPEAPKPAEAPKLSGTEQIRAAFRQALIDYGEATVDGTAYRIGSYLSDGRKMWTVQVKRPGDRIFVTASASHENSDAAKQDAFEKAFAKSQAPEPAKKSETDKKPETAKKPEAPTAGPLSGQDLYVSPLIDSGVRFRSNSGRELSPVPKLDASNNRKRANSLRRYDAWLLDEGRREIGGNPTLFSGMTAGNLSPSDRDLLNDTLFGDDGPSEKHIIEGKTPAAPKPAPESSGKSGQEGTRPLTPPSGQLEKPEEGAKTPPDDHLPGKLPAGVPTGAGKDRPEGVPGTGPHGEDQGTPEGKVPGGKTSDGGDTGAGAKGQPGKPKGSAGGKAGGGKGDGAPGPGPEGETPGVERPGSVRGKNYQIAPGALGEERSPKTKALDNIRAIELVKQINADGRIATADEQAELARYVGWGGLSGAFENPTTGKFGEGLEDVGKRLRELLTQEEYRQASASTQYAHYTAENVINAMWDAVRAMGFKGGSVFEPGMGVGHFLGLMPPDMAAASRYAGIERDPITADIAKLLYPQSGVRQGDYIATAMPENFYDLAIGNPPFSDTPILADPKYKARRFFLHDYFFAKTLDSVRPGGLLAFVTSAGTMNKLDTKARAYLGERAEFVGGVRLPSTAFKKNAGTEVTTDVLFFKKREAPLSAKAFDELFGKGDPQASWADTVMRELPNSDGEMMQGAVSRYFSEHPEQVLGQEGFFDKLYKNRYGVHAIKGSDLTADLKEAVARLPKDIMDPPPQHDNEKALADLEAAETKDGSFYLKDGKLYQYSGGKGVPVGKRGAGQSGGMTAAEHERVVALVPIRNALRDVFRHDLSENAAGAAAARKTLNAAYDAFTQKYGPINRTEFQYVRPNRLQQERARFKAREDARAEGEPWDEGSFDPDRMERAGASVSAIAKARAEARERPGYSEGSFDPDAMDDIVREKHPNIDAFMDDPESYRMRAIEQYDGETGKGEKKRIFFENVITRELEPALKSAQDGVMWSLNKFGRLDLPAISAKMTVPESKLIEDLGDAVFKVPGTDNTYQMSDEYLSGDIPDKIALATEAARSDPDYQRNVDALQAAMPVPLSPAQIRMRLGMPWIPADQYKAFIKDKLDLGKADVAHVAAAGGWRVADKNQETPLGQAQWSTEDVDAFTLLSNAMNQTTPKIFRRWRDPDGSQKSELNVVATQAAADKIQEIKNAFHEWAGEGERSDALADIYNRDMNRNVLRGYDGSYLSTPGVSSEWRWRPHQRRAVARIILSGNTYLGHTVGAGKTSEMIGAGMEMRRLGLVKKPMYVVPNHMLGQFAKEFYEQYPNAKIAVADDRRFHTDRRKQFMANVAQDDLDAVIITHTSFGLIPLSVESQTILINEELDNLREAIKGLDKQNDRHTIKRIENQMEKLQQRLQGAMSGKKDQTNTFEEMGVDFLFIDEAHEFRKLNYATRQQLKGIDPDGSDMAWDLYAKIHYLEGKTPGRSVVLASGTPITNTIAELYTLSRYLQRPALKRYGVQHFDSWSSAFGDTKTGQEPNAAGTYESVTRFAKFVNMPELYRIVGEVMDIVTGSELDKYVVRPKLKGGKREFHLAPRTPWTIQFQEGLAQRMEAIKQRKRPARKGEDIILSVVGHGRLAAIDPRLPPNPGTNADAKNSKLSELIKTAVDIYHRTHDVQFYDPGSNYQKKTVKGPAVQIIFSNLGVNAKLGRPFTVYAEIRRGLIAGGVKPDEIAFIRDYKKVPQRQKLFNDMNAGKVRFLIGSTEQMGTGINVQKRLYAIHNLDPLWYPADDEQRMGRILRQGNMNPEIEAHDYSTKGTYDSTMWQMMGRKARFIEQFLRGDPNVREIEDVGEAGTYEQAAAMSTTDDRVIKLTEMKHDLEKLERRKTAHESNQYALRQKLKGLQSSIAEDKRWIATQQANIKQREDISGDNFRMTVAGKEYATRSDAAEALAEEIKKAAGTLEMGETKKLGKIGGFDLVVYRALSKDLYLSFSLYGANGSEIGLRASTPAGIFASAADRISGFENNIKSTEHRIALDTARIASITPQIGQEFTEDEPIAKLRGEVWALEQEIQAGPVLTSRAKTPKGGWEERGPKEGQPKRYGTDLQYDLAPQYSRIDEPPSGLAPQHSWFGKKEAPPKAEEKPAAVEEPADETVGIGANVERLVQLFGQKMYEQDLPDVSVKELLQNSFDGVKSALNRGVLKPGEGQIAITLDSTDRTITIRDNGGGMNREIIKKAFLEIGGTSKEDLTEAQRSGGLGLAKLAFIFGNDGLHLTTVRDGVKYTLNTNGKELLAKKATLHPEPTDEAPYTIVTVKLPKKTPTGKDIFFSTYSTPSILGKPLLGDVAVSLQRGKNGKPEWLPIGRNTDLSKTPKLTTAHFPWGDIDVYMGDRTDEFAQKDVLSAGLWQFNPGIPTAPGSFDSLPYRVILDVKPKVEATDENYPFNNTREDWSDKVEKDIQQLYGFLQRRYQIEEANKLSGSFTDAQTMPLLRGQAKDTAVAFRDLGFKEHLPNLEGQAFSMEPDIEIANGKWISIGGQQMDTTEGAEKVTKLSPKNFKFPDNAVPGSEPYFHSNLNVDIIEEAAKRYGIDPNDARIFFAKVGTVVLDFRNALAKVSTIGADVLGRPRAYSEWGEPSRPVGVSLDKGYHGVYTPVPVHGFFINPITPRDDTSVEATADAIMETMLHEGTHTFEKSHGATFIKEMALLNTAFVGANPGLKKQLVARLEQIITDHADSYAALRKVFDDPATKNVGDSIGTESERSETAPRAGGLPDRARGVRQAAPMAGGLREGDGDRAGTGEEGRDLRGSDEDLSPQYSRITRPPGPPFADPDTEKRWKKARAGIGGTTAIARAKAWFERLGQGLTRHWIDLPNVPKYADLQAKLRTLEANPDAATAEIVREMKKIVGDMDAGDLDLFTRKVVLDDLQYEADEGHNLPFGLTAVDVPVELAKVNAALAGRPELVAKLRARKRLVDRVANDMVKAGVLDAERLKNPAYFRHQVLDYAQAQAYGAKKKLKTPFWAQRLGSVKDINANYIEAEFEWLRKALNDIATAKTIDWIKDSPLNIRKDVQAAARRNNDGLVDKAIKTDLAGPNAYVDSKGKTRSPLFDQWMGFRQRIGMGVADVKSALDSGALVPPPQFTAIATALQSGTGTADGMLPFFGWILDNNEPGAMGAATAFKAINERRAWTKRLLGKQFGDVTNMAGLEAQGYVPKGYSLWQPREGKIFFTTQTMNEKAVGELVARIANAKAGDLATMLGLPPGALPAELQTAILDQLNASARETLAVGGERYTMILPDEVAATLDQLRADPEEHIITHLAGGVLGKWKQWVLINPLRVAKYNLNNLIGDMDAVIAGNPHLLTHVPAATAEIWQVMKGKQAPSQTYTDAVERGVFNAGLTIQEIPDIHALSEFAHLTQKSTGAKVVAPIGALWRALRDYTAFRENILRYAAYLDYHDRLAKGQPMSKIGYGASNRKMVNATSETEDKAALLARDLIGDYSTVSHYGQGIRKNLIPFWSWTEINTKRYWRLTSNAFQHGWAKGAATAGGMGAALGARVTAGLLLRMIALSALMYLWNNLLFGDEEDKLTPEQQRDLHVNLGEWNGNVHYIRVQGALMDALSWLGFTDAIGAMGEVAKGRGSVWDVLGAVAKAPVKQIAPSFTPLIELPITLATGQSFFPDVFNPLPVRDGWREVFRLFSFDPVYDAVMGKPTRGVLTTLQSTLVMARDPKELAYDRIRGLTFDYLAKIKGESGVDSSDTDRTEAYREWRTAARYGDKWAAKRAYEHMRALKITPLQANESLQRVAPIGAIPARERQRFLKTLTPAERKMLGTAQDWYRETFQQNAREAMRAYAAGRAQ